MICWSFTFVVMTLVAIAVGTGATAASAVVFAKLLLIVFLGIFATFVITGVLRRPPAPSGR